MDLIFIAEERFANLAAEYQARKELAESLVCTWGWAKTEVWDLNPLFFELHGQRPGRRSKKEPAKLYGTRHFGTDASGRIVVERKHTEFGCYEQFFDWSKDPVEITYFDYSPRKDPINFQLARHKRGQIAEVASSAQRGARLERFHWEGPRVVQIDIQAASRTDKGLQKLQDYQIVRATYSADGAVSRVAIDWLPRLPQTRELITEIVFDRQSLPAVIDLRQAAVQVQQLLVNAVAQYGSKHADLTSTKQHPPVTLIELIFSLGDTQSTPWIHLCLGTAPGTNAGDGYSHPDFATLQLREWLPSIQAIGNGGKAKVVTTDGKSRKCGDGGLTKCIGEFLVATLLTARKEGVFDGLPRAPRCELGVEDPTTGSFGWPIYQDRGKDNLV